MWLKGKVFYKFLNFRLNLYMITLIFFICSPAISCNTKQITDAYLLLLAKEKLPKSLLLSVSPDEIAMITNQEIKALLNLHGATQINIYKSTNGKLTLKKVGGLDLDIVLKKFITDMSSSYFNNFIISKDGIFFFASDIGAKALPHCYSQIFYKKSFEEKKYHIFSKRNSLEENKLRLTKDRIVTHLFSSNQNFEPSESTIILNLQGSRDLLSLRKKINNLRQKNRRYEKIIIKPQRFGVQLSEIEIPLSAYDRALYFKDENELFYSTTFKASKNPKLTKSSKTQHKMHLELRDDTSIFNIGSSIDINEYLSSNITFQYESDKLDISELQLKFKDFNKGELLNVSKLGKFSPHDAGILLNTNKLNIENDALIKGAIYFGLKPGCEKCIKNAALVGLEKYNEMLDGYTKANFMLQNKINRSDKILELSFKKKLAHEKYLNLSTQYNIGTQMANISARLNISLDSINTTGVVSYKSSFQENISNWLDNSSNGLLENTTGFLKRNWQSYVNFNQ